jgi:hypothetical protein
MKTTIKKTLITHPRAKYTRNGIKLKWDELSPEYRKELAKLCSRGEGSVIIERGKRYYCAQSA